MKDRERVAMDARMDGLRSVTERIGDKVKLSEMELITLCNFAQIGLLAVFSSLDEPHGGKAEAELDALLQKIRVTFEKKGGDGLTQLGVTCAAMLGGERLGKYVLKAKGDGEK